VRGVAGHRSPRCSGVLGIWRIHQPINRGVVAVGGVLWRALPALSIKRQFLGCICSTLSSMRQNRHYI